MELDNQAVDAALILEDKLKERVSRIVEKVVINIVGREIHAAIEREKETMMMEIAITLGKTLLSTDNQGRKPLWDSKPEDFGFEPDALKSHMLGQNIDKPSASPVQSEGEPAHQLELNYALQEQSRP